MIPLAFFVLSARSENPSEACGKFSTSDCYGCIEGRGTWGCGWCAIDRSCRPGAVNGSLNPGPCFYDRKTIPHDWIYDKKDERCVDDSSKALPSPLRVGLGVGVLIIFLVASGFWCFIFPRYFMPQVPREVDLPINTEI
jgi:hypothetical protein